LTVTGPGGSDDEIKTNYITVSEVAPVAGFSGTPTTGMFPLTVVFSDASSGVISGYAWDFGDTTTSTDKNPSHQYTAAGTYTVKLTVTGPGGSDDEIKTNYITVSEVAPVAGFSGTPTTGTVPLSVAFSDASAGTITSYLWNFGDTTTSTDKNPSHQYTAAGTYMVKLTVTGPGGSDDEIKTNYITVSEVAPVAGFSGIPTSGTVPFSVQFTDTSIGTITSYLWDFGDTTTSTDKNPLHQYTAAGTYTVKLTVTGPGGSNTKTMTNYITATGPVRPVAGFSGTPTSGRAPLTVAFTDASTGIITSYLWDFGDGTTSTDKNPSHQYTAAGRYTVKLTVSNTVGINTMTKKNYITVK
jgi:PKD repeat protein